LVRGKELGFYQHRDAEVAEEIAEQGRGAGDVMFWEQRKDAE